MLDDDIVHGAEKTSDNNYNLKTDCIALADLAEIEQCSGVWNSMLLWLKSKTLIRSDWSDGRLRKNSG